MIIRNFLEAKLSDDCIHEGKGLCHHANIPPADVFDAPIRFLNYTILPKGATFGAHKHGQRQPNSTSFLRAAVTTPATAKPCPAKAGDVLLNPPTAPTPSPTTAMKT